MHNFDWAIVGIYLAWMIYDGWKGSRGSEDLDGYLLAKRQLPWWAVGLSIMATQLSAITVIGTTGQGFAYGMSFVQNYLGLPIAMVILSLTLVPFYHRANIYTAYEFLERRFDVKTRTLTSLLFLCSRGLSCGVIISAPAVILALVLGWDRTLTILAIGLPTTLYTMLGGVQAVTWADVKQMAIIVLAFASITTALIVGLPAEVNLQDSLHLAGAVGRFRAIDFRFDLNETYTFWSGLLGGTFLMLSYFGCDQSQVQRYLTAKSVNQGRRSLLLSAFVKIPLQAMILGVGVLLYVFYLYAPRPMLFDPALAATATDSTYGAPYRAAEHEFASAHAIRRTAALASDRDAVVAAEARMQTARATGIGLARKARGDLSAVAPGDVAKADVNYVFPSFVTTTLPVGLIGLFVAAVFAAAMSSIAAELNALGTVTVIDFYRRLWRPTASEQNYLLVSRLATGLWGIFACVVAMRAAELGSFIEVVNRFGSFFYGSILGVFILALGCRWVSGTGAFVGLIGGMSAVALVATQWPRVSYLWHNAVGAVGVVLIGCLVSVLVPRPQGAEEI